MINTTVINEVMIKTRGRPKKNKTPEEIEQDRLKKNDYHNNYHKMRKQRDLEYAEKSRRQINDRVKRYCENNKEIIKMKRDEILRKSKLYDEVIKSMTEINS